MKCGLGANGAGDQLLARIQKAINAQQFMQLKELIMQMQSTGPQRFTQELLFETTLLLLQVGSAQIVKLLNFEVLRNFVFPMTENYHEQLQNNYLNVSKENQRLLDEVQLYYAVFQVLRRDKSVDMKLLMDKFFTQREDFNADLLRFDSLSATKLVMQTQAVLNQVLRREKLRVKFVAAIAYFDLQLHAAYYCPQVVDLHTIRLSGLKKYMFYFVYLSKMAQIDPSSAVYTVIWLDDNQEMQTLFFVRHVVAQLFDPSLEIVPLWKTPFLYKNGEDGKLQQIKNKIGKICFFNYGQVAEFLAFDSKQMPVFLCKMLLFHGHVDLALVSTVLLYTRFHKGRCMVNIDRIQKSAFDELLYSQANSILKYDVSCIFFALIDRVMKEPFYSVDLGADFKIVDYLLGLGTISAENQQRFYKYAEELSVDVYSTYQLGDLVDCELLFALMVFNRYYGAGELQNALKGVGKHIDLIYYEAYFQYPSLLQIYRSDAKVIEDELSLGAGIWDLMAYIYAYQDADLDPQTLKQLINACTQYIDATDAQQHEVKEFSKFLLRYNRDKADYIYLLQFMRLRIERPVIDLTYQPIETRLVVLLADVGFYCATDEIGSIIKLAFSYLIANRCLTERIQELLGNMAYSYVFQGIYFVTMQYLHYCEKDLAKSFLDEKASLFSRLAGDYTIPSASQFPFKSQVIEMLLEYKGLSLLGDDDLANGLQQRTLTYIDSFKLLNRCLANDGFRDCIQDEQLFDLARKYGYDIMLADELYFPFYFADAKLFDVLELYRHSLRLRGGENELIHRLQLLSLQKDITTAYKWRNELYDEAKSLNSFDDVLCTNCDQSYEEAVKICQRVRPFSLQYVCFILCAVRFKRDSGRFDIKNLITFLPAYMVEPLTSQLNIGVNATSRRLISMLNKLESYLLIFERVKQIYQALQQNDSDKSLANYYLLQYNFGTRELEDDLDQAIGLIDQQHINDYISIATCSIIALIFKLSTFDERIMSFIGRIAYLPVLEELYLGVLYIVQVVKDNVYLQYYSKTSKLLKALMAPRCNTFIVSHYLGLRNPLEQQTRSFVLQLLGFLAKQPDFACDCSKYNLVHPLHNQKVREIAMRRFSSQNLVFKLECWYADGLTTREVVKISAEDYVQLLYAQALFAKVNNTLYYHNQVFPERTIYSIKTVPMLEIAKEDEQSSELTTLLERLNIKTGSRLFVVIMPFVNFECVFQAVSPFLGEELKQRNIYLSDKVLNEISGFTPEQFGQFQNQLSHTYITAYFKRQAPRMYFSLLNNFTVSYAASMLLCALLGIGDRHLDNICMDYNGAALQIDLEHMFFGGLKQRWQEVVPLRYTRLFQKAIPERAFKWIMYKTYEVLKEEGLLQEIINLAPNSIIRLMIRERAEGKYRGASGIEEELQCFIDDSKKDENLVKMYKGWIPWL